MRHVAIVFAAASSIGAGLSGCYAVGEREVPVWTRELSTTRYVRANLRADNVFLKSAADLNEPIAVRLGAPATIEYYGARRVDLRINHLRYTMYPEDGRFDTSAAGVDLFVEKYLTSDAAAVARLADPADALGSQVGVGEVAVGMTKEHVYTALGPPRWIETYIPTLHMSRRRVIEADRWVYSRKVFAELIPQEQAYIFNGGVLVQAIPGS